MLNITIISVGRCKEKYLLQAFSEYEKRLKTYIKFELIEIDEVKLLKPTSSDILRALSVESEKICSKLPENAYIIPLCIEGDLISSEKLSSKIKDLSVNGISKIVFLIGGSHGLSEEIKSKGHFKLSMSKMTFPHHLARVMLAEQIYRAFSIINNSKYHK